MARVDRLTFRIEGLDRLAELVARFERAAERIADGDSDALRVVQEALAEDASLPATITVETATRPEEGYDEHPGQAQVLGITKQGDP